MYATISMQHLSYKNIILWYDIDVKRHFVSNSMRNHRSMVVDH